MLDGRIPVIGWLFALGAVAGLAAGIKVMCAMGAHQHPIAARPLALGMLTVVPVGLGAWQALEFIPEALLRSAVAILLIMVGSDAVVHALRAPQHSIGSLGAYLHVMIHAGEGITVALALGRLAGNVPVVLLAGTAGLLAGFWLRRTGKRDHCRKPLLVVGVCLIGGTVVPLKVI